MKRSTSFAIFTMSTLSFVASVTTLGIVAFGAKKMQEELDEVKDKTNGTVRKLKQALNNLDF